MTRLRPYTGAPESHIKVHVLSAYSHQTKRRLKRQSELRGKGLQDLDAQLRKIGGFAFYNTSRYDFDKLLADAPHLAADLRNYIAGFSPNMREVLEKFDFDNTISKLDEAGGGEGASPHPAKSRS